jgi:asparagine synthase (glutamine-hydrolysing)
MCGIAGSLGFRAPGLAERMAAALVHRGPDDRGAYCDPAHALQLAHRRLSILDLSPAGRQPLSLCGRYQIVYNGEVYNFADLRRELEERGHTFRSRTDGEVVLAAYAEWGPACLPRLRGMFAFAVWDAREGALFLARDRFGIKPLYYARTSSGFLFASEVGALLASGEVARETDPEAVWGYLSHGRVAQPGTIVRGVRALPAGHWLRVKGGELRTERWWDLEEETRSLRSELAALPYAEAVAGVRARLEEATRLHLLADVPVGAFLSGGVDSTVVVGLMSRLVRHPIRTYSVGFDAPHAALSELKWARIAAERFGTDHTEVVVTAEDAARAFDPLVAALDQPSVDGTNTFLVSEAARRGVTVALSGLGGDELFAGYPHFRALARADALAPRGVPAGRALAAGAARVLPGRWGHPLKTLAASPAERLHRLRLLSDEDEKRRIASPRLLRRTETVDGAARAAALLRDGLDPVAQISYAEAGDYLRDTLLRDADATSMAHALEVRPVLLDHALAEYAFALPAAYKLSGTVAKRVLLDAAADVLPREVVARPKMGFELPLGAWLRTTLRERAGALLASEAARAVFAPAFLRAAEGELRDGRSRPHRLWAYVVLLASLEHHRLELDA